MKLTGTLFMCCCLALLSACAGTQVQESTGEYIDDTVITSKVIARLTASKDTSIASINVETYKGIVQLSGFVATQEEATRAEEIAASVQGVRRVENKLTVTVGVGSLYLTERPSCRELGY